MPKAPEPKLIARDLRRWAALSLVALALAGWACQRERQMPMAGSEAFREVVSAFHAGLAAMEVSADAHAEAEFLRVTRLAPAEPAAWANLGLLALRRNELDVAAERLERARELDPTSSEVQMLLAAQASQVGRTEVARAHYRKAIELDSANVRAMFALADELERTGDPGAAMGWLERILARQPSNLAVWVALARLAAKGGDADALQRALARLDELEAGWPLNARERLDSAQAAAAGTELRRAARELTFLRNLLSPVPSFRDDLAELRSPDERVGEPLERFLALPSPRPAPAPADTSLRFDLTPLAPSQTAAWSWVGTMETGAEGERVVLLADGDRIRTSTGLELPFPGDPGIDPPASGVLAIDFDNDYRTDVVLAGFGGLRLFRQDTTGSFTDVTAETGLPSAITGAPLTSARALDVELDGDLDILVSGLQTARVLRNNGDGTFYPIEPFDIGGGIRDWVWADLDGDGDADAALVDGQGGLRRLRNERQGRFTREPQLIEQGEALAIAAEDIDRDGVLDLIVLRDDGSVVRLAPDTNQPAEPLVRWGETLDVASPRRPRLAVADLDNNGALDLIVSAGARTRAWLQDADGYRPIEPPLDLSLFEVAAVGPDAGPGLLGLGLEGEAMHAVARGSAAYDWVRLRPRAAERAGDQRINSYGLGGTVELRSGLLYQKRPITGPSLHFGLGEAERADVARIVWPNGLVQAEFELAAGQTVRALQRLKGSCPWVFADDGTGIRFITDFLWRSPLGMRINSQEAASVATTGDWVRIRGDQLAARDGVYDLRITAELWETHFIDQVALRVVDHPEGTEVFVDERFAFPPPEPAVHATGPLQPLAGARTDRGRDVSELVRRRDGDYLAGFELGDYQGVARDHYVEVELGSAAHDSGPVWLLATGWVRPTDSSINVALSQGDHPPPRGLRLEVPDGRGGWRVALDELGFPAGKSKTVLIDLDGVLTHDGRLRLATNLEIYWDRIAWAFKRPDAELRLRDLAPEVATLGHRGFSKVVQEAASAPERPLYDSLAGTAPRWLDLEGYYTRYGEVRRLLKRVDDRYVIMNAGDELRLRFPAPPPPAQGWRRDFVLLGDGWVKDGDYNTNFSGIVLPLPRHGQPDYSKPPDRLENDPVYRRHSRDWEMYHTRYVEPSRFRRALIPGPDRR